MHTKHFQIGLVILISISNAHSRGKIQSLLKQKTLVKISRCQVHHGTGKYPGDIRQEKQLRLLIQPQRIQGCQLKAQISLFRLGKPQYFLAKQEILKKIQ